MAKTKTTAKPVKAKAKKKSTGKIEVEVTDRVDVFGAIEPATGSKKKSDDRPVIKADGDMANKIELYVAAKASAEKAAAAVEAVEGEVREWAVGEYAELYAGENRPKNPRCLGTNDTSVLLTYSDRAMNASPETVEALAALVGEEHAANCVETTTGYSVDPDIVREILADGALRERVSAALIKVLGADKAGGFFKGTETRKIKKGTIDQASKMCDGNTDRIVAFLGIVAAKPALK